MARDAVTDNWAALWVLNSEGICWHARSPTFLVVVLSWFSLLGRQSGCEFRGQTELLGGTTRQKHKSNETNHVGLKSTCHNIWLSSSRQNHKSNATNHVGLKRTCHNSWLASSRQNHKSNETNHVERSLSEVRALRRTRRPSSVTIESTLYLRIASLVAEFVLAIRLLQWRQFPFL